MKLKNIICAISIGVILFSQTAFATQETQGESAGAQTLPQTENAAPEEAAPDTQLPQDYGGRMPGRGGMGGPGGMRGEAGNMQPPERPDMQMPEQTDAQTGSAEASQEQLPQTNEGENSTQLPQDNMMRGQMPQDRGGMGQNFEGAMQEQKQQSTAAEESFLEKNFTLLVSFAALVFGFLFVVLYKRKTF